MPWGSMLILVGQFEGLPNYTKALLPLVGVSDGLHSCDRLHLTLSEAAQPDPDSKARYRAKQHEEHQDRAGPALMISAAGTLAGAAADWWRPQWTHGLTAEALEGPASHSPTNSDWQGFHQGGPGL